MSKIAMLWGEKRIPKQALFIIIFLLIVSLIVLTGLQQPDSSTQAGSIEYKIATEELGSGKDIVIGIDNITLYIPGSAITQAGSISLYPRKPISSYEAGELTWYRPFVVSIDYRNNDGAFYSQVRFSSPVEICFKLPRRLWEDYLNHSDEYQVQYLIVEEAPPRWEALPFMSYSERSELCGQTEYISVFSLAIKSQELIPVTGITPSLPQDVYEP